MTERKIVLKDGGGHHEESLATAVAIRPGDLLEKLAAATVQKQSTASETGLNPEMLFAKKDIDPAKDISDSYDVSVQIQTYRAMKGDIIRGWLADGENVVVGDDLMVDGAGGWKEKTGSLPSHAVAEEAVDLSASLNTADGRITIRIK